MFTAWQIGPQNFFPRFFLWLVPLAAVAIAAGVRRAPVLAVVVVIALVPQARDVYRFLSRDEFANRTGAAILLSEARHGRRVCATGPDSETLLGSLDRDDFHVIRSAGSLNDCQVVVVVSPARHRNLIASARTSLPALLGCCRHGCTRGTCCRGDGWPNDRRPTPPRAHRPGAAERKRKRLCNQGPYRGPFCTNAGVTGRSRGSHCLTTVETMHGVL